MFKKNIIIVREIELFHVKHLLQRKRNWAQGSLKEKKYETDETILSIWIFLFSWSCNRKMFHMKQDRGEWILYFVSHETFFFGINFHGKKNLIWINCADRRNALNWRRMEKFCFTWNNKFNKRTEVINFQNWRS